MRYCGHFLIKAEGGAKKYERDHPLRLATLYRRFRGAKGLQNGSGLTLPKLRMRGMRYYYDIRTSIHIYIYIY